MIIWGFSTTKKVMDLDPQAKLIMTFRYFHIFWALRLAWGRKFMLAQLAENGWSVRDVSVEDAAQLLGGEAPNIHPWQRWSFLGFIGFIVMLSVIFGVLGSQG